MKEETPLGATAQSAIQRAAVLCKPRLATFNFNFYTQANAFVRQQNKSNR
jgi:hypothetical protein